MYTVTATWADDNVACAYPRDREEADTIFGDYLRDYPQAEVVLRDGDHVLVSVGRLPVTDR